MNQEDKSKTAFATRRRFFQFNVMQVGLCCPSATFRRLTERVMALLNWLICHVYLDDIIVKGKTFEEVLLNLRKVFDRFKDIVPKVPSLYDF